MHDPKLIEAMARAIGSRLVLRGSVNDAATDALRDLCAARPDVAALLSGEAVAVPREATHTMLIAGLGAYINWREAKECECLDEREVAGIWKDMLAATPWAQKEKRDAE